GAVARKILGGSVNIRGALVQIGPHGVDRGAWDWDQVSANPFFCPDKAAAGVWESYLDEIRKSGSSIGAVVEVTASGVPAGLGAPVFDRLDADLAKALMSIPAVKGVEIGAGFAASELTGPENADGIRAGKDGPEFLSNNAGGTLGGISSGQDIVARFAVKPTSSVSIPQKTINAKGENVEIAAKGRHDPCIGIRAVPVGEAMVALVLADHLLRHKAQCGA
ncbi:MAG TPA: chorismate synthase, partial [Rhodospirillales bacterium]|nr:chorismate synthase [Rhodospirillales bacterium]